MTNITYGPTFILIRRPYDEREDLAQIIEIGGSLKTIQEAFHARYGFEYDRNKGLVQVIEIQSRADDSYTNLFHAYGNRISVELYCKTEEINTYGYRLALDSDGKTPLTNEHLSARERLLIVGTHDETTNVSDG